MHTDPCKELSDVQIEGLIKKIFDYRLFGDLSRYSDTKTTVQGSRQVTIGGITESEIVRKLASTNAEVPVQISYHLPKIPTYQTVFDKYVRSTPPTTVDTQGYSEVHPLRHTLPVRGPGSSNFAAPCNDQSYLRVAGALASASVKVVESVLPRYIPVMIDIIVYHMKEATAYPSSTERSRKINEGMLVCHQFVAHLTLYLSTHVGPFLDSNLSQCNQFIKERMVKYGDLIAKAVKTRADMGLSGQGGVVLPATKMLHLFLTKTKNVLYSRLKADYDDIATLISLECLSYAKAADVIDVAALSKQKEQESFHVEVSANIPQIFHGIQKISQSPRRIDTFSQLSPFLSHDHALKFGFQNFRFPKINIELNLTSFFSRKNITSSSPLKPVRTDRSKMCKSGISYVPSQLSHKIKNHRKKMNGFQYGLTYESRDNTNTIMARYVQAPQATAYVQSALPFHINLEVYALDNNELRASVISIYYIGPIVFDHPDSLTLNQFIQPLVSITVNSSVTWEYTKHDGVIIETKNETHYVKPNKECDLFYHPHEESLGRYVVTKINGHERIVENPVASRILRLHAAKKNEKYVEGLKQTSRKAYENFQKESALTSKFLVTLQPWYQHVSEELKRDLNSSCDSFPRVEECYNVPLIHNNVPHSIVQNVKSISLEEKFIISETEIETTKQKELRSQDSSVSFKMKVMVSDFSN